MDSCFDLVKLPKRIFGKTPLSGSSTLQMCGCGWKQHSRSPTACVWKGKSSNNGSVCHVRLCQWKAKSKVGKRQTSPAVWPSPTSFPDVSLALWAGARLVREKPRESSWERGWFVTHLILSSCRETFKEL